MECIHSADWVFHEKSLINDRTLFAAAILADEAIPFDNSSIFSQILHKHEDCGMSLLNRSSFRLLEKRRVDETSVVYQKPSKNCQ